MSQQALRTFRREVGLGAPRGHMLARNGFGRVTTGARRSDTVVVFAAKGAKSTAAKGFGAPKPQSAKGIAADAPCPCGSGSLYEACCSLYYTGPSLPPTPEALLRARYSAYVAKEPSFIADTTHPDSPEYTGSRASYTGTVKQTMRRLDPLGLTILGPTEAGASPDEAFITFRLKRRVKDPEAKGALAEVDELTERSRFVRAKGRWMYIDSQFIEEEAEAAQNAAEGAAAAAAKQQEPPKKKGFLNLF